LVAGARCWRNPALIGTNLSEQDKKALLEYLKTL
jgi:hypothetical protein